MDTPEVGGALRRAEEISPAMMEQFLQDIVDNQTKNWLKRHHYANVNDVKKVIVKGHAPRLYTPLHAAVQHNDVTAIGFLLWSGADRSAQDHKGRTPLDFAKMMFESDDTYAEAVDALQNHPVITQDWCEHGNLPEACEKCQQHAREKMRRVDQFLKVNDFASIRGCIRRPRFLVKDKILHPLHAAVESNDEGMVELLLWAGAEVDVRDHKGRTPAELAMNLNKNGSHLGVLSHLTHTLESASTTDSSIVRNF